MWFRHRYSVTVRDLEIQDNEPTHLSENAAVAVRLLVAGHSEAYLHSGCKELEKRGLIVRNYEAIRFTALGSFMAPVIIEEDDERNRKWWKQNYLDPLHALQIKAKYEWLKRLDPETFDVMFGHLNDSKKGFEQ